MATIPPRERLSQMMSALLSARHWTLERAMREWARTDDAVAASVRAADQRTRCRPPSVSGLRVRCRGRGPARQRDVRRRNRVSASVRRDAERPRGGSSGTLPRPHADALTRSLPYLKVWYVRRHDRCSGHVAGYQPRVRRQAGRAGAGGRRTAQAAQRHRQRLRRVGIRRAAGPRARRRRCRPRGRRFPIRSVGWRTDARPAPVPSASTPCTRPHSREGRYGVSVYQPAAIVSIDLTA